ncbi:MAG TPA: plasmid pRiA4b ORF-3 family protein [Pirellulales bacterium]|nr:plasmid pRiA4b ORF-3 family protein [Pirellulales bacterium]
MAQTRKAKTKLHEPAAQGTPRLYTMEVFLRSGPLVEKFVKKNPVISRTIQIRGDQTLEDLHHAIFAAFGRWDEHMYEFQFGKGPMDPKAPRYVLPDAIGMEMGDAKPPAGRVDKTTLDSLDLEVNRSFGYWFDFGDDWWHQIDVTAIGDEMPEGKLPKVIKKVGQNPPQYTDADE